LVALRLVQNSYATSIGLDGEPICEHVEVMVNMVYKRTTKLPRPRGRMIKMESAEAKCIPWPRSNVLLGADYKLIYDSSLILQTISFHDMKFDKKLQLKISDESSLGHSKSKSVKKSMSHCADTDTNDKESCIIKQLHY
jgi:hypothetical protein